jgi:hypothetical protein
MCRRRVEVLRAPSLSNRALPVPVVPAEVVGLLVVQAVAVRDQYEIPPDRKIRPDNRPQESVHPLLLLDADT